MLHLKKVCRHAADHKVLTDVTFSVDPGELVSVLGPTGSGKTSLLRVILGLDAPSSGEVWWDHSLMASAEGNLVAPERRGISMVFEKTLLLPFLDVRRNVSLGLRQLETADEQRREELLGLLELQALAERRPSHLSGGEQQRVALARSLFVKPRLLLLDEPFRNIDRPWRDRFLPVFMRYLSEQRMTAIMVTHDRDEAFGFSQRILTLRDGRLLRSATPQQLYQQPESGWAARLLGECNQLPVELARQLLDFEAEDAQVTSVLVRPEHIDVSSEPPHNAVLRELHYYGFYWGLELEADGEVRIQVKAPSEQAFEPGVGYRLRLRRPDLARALRSGIGGEGREVS